MVGKELTSGNLLVIMTAGWYVLCLSSAVARRCARRISAPDGVGDDLTPFAFYQHFSMATLAVVVGVFLLSRTSSDLLAHKHWDNYARYFVGPIGLAFFGWPIWITLMFRRAVPTPMRAVSAAAPIVLSAWSLGTTGPRSNPDTMT